MYSFDVKITSTAEMWDSIQLTVTQDIKVNKMSDMQSQISKKKNIKRKKKLSYVRINLSKQHMSDGKVSVRNII